MEKTDKELIELVLKHPPEIPLMARNEKEFDLIREKDFIRKFGFWILPGIDTTSFAFQIFQLIAEYSHDEKYIKTIKTFINHEKENIRKFIFNLFDPVSGGFFQTNINELPTLHAIHSTIAFIKAFNGIELDRKIDFDGILGKEEYESFFDHNEFYLQHRGITHSIINYVNSCYDPATGGFFETPKKIFQRTKFKRVPSINNTASAIWICYQLDEALCKTLNLSHDEFQKNIFNFIHDLQVEIEKDKYSFKNSIIDDNSWVCSIYYAERTLRNIGHEFFQNNFSKFLNFLSSSKIESSGYCAGNSLDANLIHTKNALSLIRRYFHLIPNRNEVANTIINDHIRFLKSTYYKGAFGIAEPKKFAPNLYSTRMAFDIMRYLEFFAEEIGLEKPIFDFVDPQETIQFILSCYNYEKGGFHGFTTSIEYVNPEYINWHFSLAA